MDKIINMNLIKYTSPIPPTKECSQLMILQAIHDLTDISINTLIDSIHIEFNKIEDIISSPSEETDSQTNNIIINSVNTRCISINGKTPNAVIEFTAYLNSIGLIDPLMNKAMYDRFRKNFTELYYEAFFNEGEKTWSFDTDEINDLLDYKCFRFRVIQKKINDIFYWRLVDINIGLPSEESWKELISSYIPQEEIKKEKENGLKTELSDYIESQRNAFPLMNQTIYRIFSTGFKNIYNRHVNENDQYEKITYKNINNILKMYKLPYLLDKDHGNTFIKKCE